MKKHALSTRLWHWINLICLVVLLMSGLNISNAHRYLYWGDAGFSPSDAWLAIPRFPGWMTIPDYYSLAAARDWHILMAWPFAVGLLIMWIAMLVNGHFWRDLRTRLAEWRPRAVWRDIVQHARLNFDHDGPDELGAKYNFLQKLTYGVVFGVMLPGMVLTGMAMSPGFEPVAPWLVDVFGGRQSARSLHFLCSGALFGFFILHVALVLLNKPWKLMRSMITGNET